MAMHVLSQRWDVKWVAGKVLIIALLLPVTVSAKNTTSESNEITGVGTGYHAKVFYQHSWPSMKYGWKIIVGTIVGFLGSAFGNVGGVGGGGIFVPMLTLIIGFDAKSAIAISKCMITGGATATVFYNLRQRHPTLDLPVIDYDLALLFQPMLMLGISIGVSFNVIFPDWMLTTLLIISFTGISVKSFFKGVDTWKQETLMMKVSVIDNVHWKELGLLFAVWIMILALEIGKNYTTTCSGVYWVINLLQVPIAVGMSSYQAMRLYKGQRIIASKGDQQTHWRVLQLIVFCACGILAGTIAGLLGLGGGFILAPLFLGLGIPPQVASATSILAMAFSASFFFLMYGLFDDLDDLAALYFVAVATAAALVGQHLVRKVIAMLGRASVIIFILTLTLCVSAVLLGKT
ncbi:Sulfite exporter TauE/SafE family protein 3 [Glycine soja]|uniref:Sulfite exporter TauE/SafE family protein 3 n=1 Tax=Glycine soja TaxID=3848 RepID=A0A445KPV4_GLYSO|nr:Sulfite exporter TauE/SafE family protein 3 [Glycine soja]